MISKRKTFTPTANFLILLAVAALAALGALTLLAGAARASGGVQAHVVYFGTSPDSATLTGGQSADIDVHFDQPVFVTGDPVLFLGVGADDFGDLAHYQSGSGTDTLVFHWTPKPGLEGPVSLRTLIDAGTPDTTIKDDEGVDADTRLSWVYTPTGLYVNTTGPLVDVNPDAASSDHVRSGPISFRASFSEAVTNVDLSDFALTKTGSATGLITSIDQLDPVSYRFTVDGVGGDGNVALTLLAGNDIVDADGNPLSPAADRTSDPYVVDNAKPKVVSFTPTTFADGTLHFELVFDEDVFNVNPGIFDADSTGSLDWYEVGIADGATNHEFDVTVDQVTGSGTLTLTVNDDAATVVEDQAGNQLDLSGAPTASSTVPDTTPPAFANFDWFGNPDGIYYAGEQFIVAISWDEPVVVTGTPRLPLTLAAGSADAVFDGLSWDEKTAYFVYTVAPGQNVSGLGVGDIVLSGGTIADLAGHPATGGSGGLHTLNGVNVIGTTRPSGNPAPPPAEPPAATPQPAPAPAPKDTIAPTKPASPAAKVMGRQLQVSFGSSTDNVKVVGYRLFRDGTAIATIDGLSFKQLLTLGKPGKSVLQLRAFDAAGNQSDPLVLTLTRLAAPKVPKVKPAWAWKLSRWQQAPTATRGIRPHTPNKLPNWYGKWNAWHKAPVKVTVG